MMKNTSGVSLLDVGIVIVLMVMFSAIFESLFRSIEAAAKKEIYSNSMAFLDGQLDNGERTLPKD
jgi:hypothetical protein